MTQRIVLIIIGFGVTALFGNSLIGALRAGTTSLKGIRASRVAQPMGYWTATMSDAAWMVAGLAIVLWGVLI